MRRAIVSYALGKNTLFDKITPGENFLFFYTPDDKYCKHLLYNFMRQNTKDGSILFYVVHKANQLKFNNNDGYTFSFRVIDENTLHDLKNQLHNCLDEIEGTNKDLCLVADWQWRGGGVENCKIFIPFLEDLIKKSKGLIPPGWKKRYKEKGKKTHFTLINSFEITKLNDHFIEQLLQLHERVYIFKENSNVFLLPTISPSQQVIFPKFHVLPQKVLEKVVKDNLELVVLLFLEKEKKSGYQVLKDIASHFQCILSQGTLYPLLYKLEKENKIVKQNGKGREVIYSLTEQTKKEFASRKETQLRTYQHLASFFKK